MLNFRRIWYEEVMALVHIRVIVFQGSDSQSVQNPSHASVGLRRIEFNFGVSVCVASVSYVNSRLQF